MFTSPLQTRRFRIFFAACWTCWSLLHMYVLYWFGFEWETAFTDSAVSNLLLLAASLLSTITLSYYIPARNKYGYILALCLVLSAVWLLLSRSLLMLLNPDTNDYSAFFSRSFPLRAAIGFLVIGCMSLLSVLWYTMQDQREVEKRKNEAEKLSKEAELYNLRQQLQPHFLFNSLNSINALIGSQPQLARTMIEQLSDFLRGTLKKEENQWASLEDELAHLQLYLDIEKVRFGHRLSTVINNRIPDMQARLPAMLLQPIVENAIKFGLYDTTDAILIEIEASLDNQSLVLEVRNPFDPETSSPRKGTGFGLSSVQRRLYLLFARNDLLQTEAAGSLFTTTIKIPQQ
ncbi:MAG TPA: histidine kinase [Flavisolibacter sp.]|nr:histidine kinase [Flavisolibacter sp.]